MSRFFLRNNLKSFFLAAEVLRSVKYIVKYYNQTSLRYGRSEFILTRNANFS